MSKLKHYTSFKFIWSLFKVLNLFDDNALLGKHFLSCVNIKCWHHIKRISLVDLLRCLGDWFLIVHLRSHNDLVNVAVI